MNANLEYYKVFYHVAGCGSLTQAAEIMCISQPAVSQAIKQLEMLIGGKLFLRTAKGVKLTPEGEVLYKYVKEGYETISLGEYLDYCIAKNWVDVTKIELSSEYSDSTEIFEQLIKDIFLVR